jgi:signal transduction histidine kinase
MRSGTQREPREASTWTEPIPTTPAAFNSVLLLILNAVPVPLWVATSGSECTFVNSRWTEFTGRNLETELGWGWVGGIHTGDRKRVLATIEAAINQGAEFECEYRLRRRDGEYRQIVSRGMPPILNSRNSGYVGFVWDVPPKPAFSTQEGERPSNPLEAPHQERSPMLRDGATGIGGTSRHARSFTERLLQASTRAVNAEERERRRISRELHDDFGQRIAGACSKLGAMLKASKRTSKRDVLSTTAEVLDGLIVMAEDLRTVAHQLHPAIVDLLGPIDAMKSLCRDVERLHSISVTCNCKLKRDELSHSTAIALYRILQEGLGNAVKHARAQNVNVHLQLEGDTVILRIVDDGQGFDQNSVQPGLGLITMEERAICLAGRFCIGTAPGGGCTVCVELPAHAPDE